MKKIQYILIYIILLICISGCTPKVDLITDDNKIKEAKSTKGEKQEYFMPTLSEETDYNWIDVSIVILNTILTKPDDHKGEPSAVMYLWNNTEEPVLFAGYLQENGKAEYTMYTFSGKKIIENGQCDGIVLVDKDRHQIAFNGFGKWEIYQYKDKRWFRIEGGLEKEPKGFQKMNVSSLKDKDICAENIEILIQK